MKLWIAGRDGLLGQAFVRLCSDRGDAFISTNRLDVDVLQLDQMQRFIDVHQPTHLINCTGYTNVDLAEKEEEKAFLLNAQVAENMGRLGVKVLHFSTDYVFDGAKGSPYLEDDKPNPLGVYGKSKLEGERRLLDVAPQSCVMRISWLFGKKPTHFIAKMLRLMREKELVSVATDQISRPTYAEDVAAWGLQLLGESGIWHAANAGVASRYAWASATKEICDELGIPLRCKNVQRALTADFPQPAQRPMYSVLDTGKIEAVVHLRAWREALQEYLKQEAVCHAI